MQAPVVRLIKELPKLAKRNFGVSAPALATDPIQQLFLDKLKEYRKKSQGDQLLDPSPEIEKELKSELQRIDSIFGAKGRDMTEFPKFSFAEPKIDPINMAEK